jgi:hypothetical protein
VVQDYELFFENIGGYSVWKNLRSNNIQFLGWDRQMLTKEFESNIMLPYSKNYIKYRLFEQKYMAFQGIVENLSDFVKKKKKVLVSSTNSLAFGSIGVDLPVIKFLECFEGTDLLNIKTFFLSGFSIRHSRFLRQYEAVENFLRSQKIQELGISLEYSNIRCDDSFESLKKILSHACRLEYIFFRVQGDHYCPEESDSSYNLGELIKAISVSAPLKSFAILNEMSLI